MERRGPMTSAPPLGAAPMGHRLKGGIPFGGARGEFLIELLFQRFEAAKESRVFPKITKIPRYLRRSQRLRGILEGAKDSQVFPKESKIPGTLIIESSGSSLGYSYYWDRREILEILINRVF
ncbi:hypothetical protein KIN20_036910 [Parelaphostrongylus tenuis]|uniref:Uncharacterized protein n=1 Tax=Parelaphostrongylus tenuis TaxID=148309 RepID=A0AAD5WM13_PARTN|nr:hypothetical protein KIN20_036910 [Parelaphostrongylus tenuis]